LATTSISPENLIRDFPLDIHDIQPRHVGSCVRRRRERCLALSHDESILSSVELAGRGEIPLRRDTLAGRRVGHEIVLSEDFRWAGDVHGGNEVLDA